jgi:hypothetical protein
MDFRKFLDEAAFRKSRIDDGGEISFESVPLSLYFMTRNIDEGVIECAASGGSSKGTSFWVVDEDKVAKMMTEIFSACEKLDRDLVKIAKKYGVKRS